MASERCAMKFKSIITNPLLVGIISAIFGAFLGSYLTWYLSERPKEKKAGVVFNARIENAEGLLEKNMPKDALKECNDLLEEVSVVEYPEIYARIKRNEGLCYFNLTKEWNKKTWDKVDDLKRAIHAFDEALKVYTVEKYPVDYATTQNNLGHAYSSLSEFTGILENGTKAVLAYEEALKTYTVEKYPVDYATVQWNLGSAYSRLAKVWEKEKNVKKAIRSYEEALTFYTVEEYPSHYKRIRSNIEKVK